MSKLIIKEEYGTAYTINKNNEFVGYPINKDGTIDKDCESPECAKTFYHYS